VNPSHRTTGCGGYLGKARFVFDNWQSKKRDPFAEVTSRIQAQDSHKLCVMPESSCRSEAASTYNDLKENYP
jgi:hypothetical protein